MTNTNNPLKIAEVRQLVKGHKREHLEYIVDELYKIIEKDSLPEYLKKRLKKG